MIHGHTRIKLFNPISGNILKDIESENTFQANVIANALRNLGECNASPITNSNFKNKDYWKEVVGGILLFRDEITTNTAYMSAGNVMTGNGAEGVLNSSNPPELGSYNELESSIGYGVTKKLTMTYDWGQSQGNGKISSVCLTSKTGGFIGYGNPSDTCKEKLDDSYITFLRNLDNQNADSKTAYASHQAVIVGNEKYMFSCSSGILTVKRKRVCITTGSIFDGCYKELTFDLSNVGNPFSWNNEECFCCTDNGKIYILPKAPEYNPHPYAVPVGSKMHFYVYDTSDDSLTLEYITNNSTKPLYIITTTLGSGGFCWGVSHGKLFARSSGNDSEARVEVFDLSTNAHAELDCGYTTAGNYFYVNTLPNGLTLITNYIYNGDGDYKTYIYDSINGTTYPTNMNTRGIASSMTSPFTYDLTLDALTFAKSGCTAINNPLYLATVNNLSTPVIKDGTMAMQVIYSLEET